MLPSIMLNIKSSLVQQSNESMVSLNTFPPFLYILVGHRRDSIKSKYNQCRQIFFFFVVNPENWKKKSERTDTWIKKFKKKTKICEIKIIVIESRNMEIARYNIQRILWIQKDLPFKLLWCGFDDLREDCTCDEELWLKPCRSGICSRLISIFRYL